MDDGTQVPLGVVVIMRFPGDARLMLPRWERALENWRERFPGQTPQSFAGESEYGGLVVVNRFASDDDSFNFGGGMRDLFAQVMLPTPEVEHVLLSEDVSSREVDVGVTAQGAIR